MGHPTLPNGLTGKQEAFCQNMANGMSRRDAYVGAYDVEKHNAFANEYAWELCQNPKVSARIIELQKETNEKLTIKRADLVRWHYARLTYNPDDIIKTIAGACHHCYGDGFAYQWRAHEFAEAVTKAERADKPFPDVGGGFGYNALKVPHPDCPHCDGGGVSRTVITPSAELSGAARAAYEGVKETRHGIEVKMADKTVAAQEISKLLGFNVERNPLDHDEPLEAPDFAAMDQTEIAKWYKKWAAAPTAH